MVVHLSSHGDFTCPAVLWIQLVPFHFTYQAITVYGRPSHAVLFVSGF